MAGVEPVTRGVSVVLWFAAGVLTAVVLAHEGHTPLNTPAGLTGWLVGFVMRVAQLLKGIRV